MRNSKFGTLYQLMVKLKDSLSPPLHSGVQALTLPLCHTRLSNCCRNEFSNIINASLISMDTFINDITQLFDRFVNDEFIARTCSICYDSIWHLYYLNQGQFDICETCLANHRRNRGLINPATNARCRVSDFIRIRNTWTPTRPNTTGAETTQAQLHQNTLLLHLTNYFNELLGNAPNQPNNDLIIFNSPVGQASQLRFNSYLSGRGGVGRGGVGRGGAGRGGVGRGRGGRGINIIPHPPVIVPIQPQPPVIVPIQPQIHRLTARQILPFNELIFFTHDLMVDGRNIWRYVRNQNGWIPNNPYNKHLAHTVNTPRTTDNLLLFEGLYHLENGNHLYTLILSNSLKTAQTKFIKIINNYRLKYNLIAHPGTFNNAELFLMTHNSRFKVCQTVHNFQIIENHSKLYGLSKRPLRSNINTNNPMTQFAFRIFYFDATNSFLYSNNNNNTIPPYYSTPHPTLLRIEKRINNGPLNRYTLYYIKITQTNGSFIRFYSISRTLQELLNNINNGYNPVTIENVKILTFSSSGKVNNFHEYSQLLN